MRTLSILTATMFALPAIAATTATNAPKVTPISISAAAIAVRSDGGYYTAGSIADPADAGHRRIVVAAYLANGTIDQRFGNEGSIVTDPSPLSNGVSSIAIAPDGKIVVGGSANFDNQSARGGDLLVERLTASGQLDQTFGKGGIAITDLCAACNFSDRVTGLVVQPDGKIAVSAYSSRGAGNTRFIVARYTLAGKLDAGFGKGGVVDSGLNGAYTIALQSDGKILAGGNDGGSVELFRYLTNGKADLGFGTNGKVVTPFENPFTGALQGNAVTIVLRPDGRFVVGTPFIRTTLSYQFAAIGYLANGKIDRGFGNQGLTIAPAGIRDTLLSSALLLPDGKFLLVGTYNYNNPVDPSVKETLFAARLDAAGVLDPSFGKNGIQVTDLNRRIRNNEDAISNIALRPDGRVIGAASSYNLNLGTTTYFTVLY